MTRVAQFDRAALGPKPEFGGLGGTISDEGLGLISFEDADPIDIHLGQLERARLVDEADGPRPASGVDLDQQVLPLGSDHPSRTTFAPTG